MNFLAVQQFRDISVSCRALGASQRWQSHWCAALFSLIRSTGVSIFSSGRLVACVILGLAIAMGGNANAANYTYTIPASGTDQWASGTNWGGGTAPASSSTTTLIFTGSQAAGATADSNNDIGGTFQLNKLTFSGTGPGSGTAPVFNITGNALEFLNNGVTGPKIALSGTGTIKTAVNITNDLILTNNLAVTLATNLTGNLSGVISGSGKISKSTGTSTLVLSNTANSFSGGVALTNGFLSVASLGNTGANSALGTNGTISLSTASNAGRLTWTGNSETSNKTITIGTSTGAVTLTSQTAGQVLTLQNALQITNSSSKTLTVNGNGGLVLEGGIAGSNATGTSLVKSGNGTLALGGASTYNGTTTISAGTLQIGNGATSGSLSTASGITNNATLAFNRTDTVTQGTDFASAIGGSGSLIQAGSGNLVLSGVNTYTGNTTVSSGTLEISNASALGGTGNGTTVSSGATLALSGGITVTGENLTISGSGVGGAGALRSLSGNNTWNTTGVTITLAADATIGSDADTLTLERASGSFITGANHTLTLVGAGNFTIKNNLALGTGGLTLNGTGLVTLGVNGSSSYTGATTINSGTLQIANNNRINDSSTLVINGGRFNMVNFSDTVAGVTLTSGSITGTTGVLTSASDFDLQSGTVDAIIAGSVGVNKTTSGTATLSKANTFTGATTITAGTLGANATGALGSTTNITVTGGSLLVGANDAINDSAAMTLAGGTLEFGGSITESVGALTLSANSTIDMGGGNVFLEFSNLVTQLTSTTRLNIYNYTLYSDHLYFTSNANLSDSLPYISFYSGFGTGFIGNSFIEGISPYEIRPVPEPETWATAVALLAGAGIAWARNRRHRKT